MIGCIDEYNCTDPRHTSVIEDVVVATAAYMEKQRDKSFNEAFWWVTSWPVVHGVDLKRQADAVTWHEPIIKRQVRALLASYGLKLNPWD
ncbi:MAG: hypothetical protein V1895_04190 [Parcubacteria group bacterium]